MNGLEKERKKRFRDHETPMFSNSFKHYDSCWYILAHATGSMRSNGIKNENTLLPCPSTAQTLWQSHLVWALISQAVSKENNQWKSIICTLKSNKSNLGLMAPNLVSSSKALLPPQDRMNRNSSPPGMGWEGQAGDAIPEVSWAPQHPMKDPGRMWQMRKGNSLLPSALATWQEPQTQQRWKKPAAFGSKPLLWWANFILQVKGRVWG